MSHQHSKIARRAFLQRMGQLGIAGTAAPWAINLAAISDAAAFTNDGYKALVCIFLYGGNDHGNTLIPCDASGYLDYATARGSVLTTRTAAAPAGWRSRLTSSPVRRLRSSAKASSTAKPTATQATGTGAITGTTTSW